MVLTPGPGSPLRPGGRLSRAGAGGILPRLGRRPTGKLADQVSAYSAELFRGLDGRAVAVILRGSMACGARHPADIDLFVVLRAGTSRPDVSPLPPLPLPVEISWIGRTTLLEHPSGAWPRFALAHCGWTLAGEDLLPRLPPPRLGPVAVAHLRNARRWWPHAPLDWSGALTERRLIGNWLGKRLIRSLAEGAMVRSGVYSRDIWPCLQIASRAWPGARAGLIHIAEQAVAPSGRLCDLRRMTRTAAPLLERSIRQVLERTIHLPRS